MTDPGLSFLHQQQDRRAAMDAANEEARLRYALPAQTPAARDDQNRALVRAEVVALLSDEESYDAWCRERSQLHDAFELAHVRAYLEDQWRRP